LAPSSLWVLVFVDDVDLHTQLAVALTYMHAYVLHTVLSLTEGIG